MASLLSAQPQTFYLEEWHASDGSQDETPDRVVSAYDFSGHTYVAGSTLNQYGRKDLLLTKYNSSGGEVWSEVFNLTDTTANVIVGNIILMPGPALVITGSVYNGPANNYDALTVRFDTSGNYEWHQLFNGTASYYDGGADLFFDQNNRIYITGGTTNSGTLMDFLTICYDASGNQQWVQTYDGFGLFDAAAYIDHRIVPHITVVGAVQMDDTTWTAATVKYTTAGTQYGSAAFGDEVTLDEVKDIATDDDGNIYITGYNSDDGMGRDIITLKLDEELELQWTARYDGAAHLDDEGHGVAVDASGNVYVAGHTGTASQGKDFTVLKYNAGGTLQWIKHYNGAAGMDDAARDIAVDDAGQVYVTGYCTENHTRDYFTRILSQSNGDEVWSARFNGLYNKDDEAHRLLLDPAGNITLTGKTGMPDDKTTYTTVRYVKRSILLPPDEEAASNAINYIENKGQLLRTDGEEAADIRFYCAGQYPALYFRHGGLSLVSAHIDTSAATQDTMHRVDIAFHKSKGDERIYALEERPEFYNYYLGHIPEGRERVRLHDRLVHTDAFPGIDVQYYSNGGGVKYYIVCQPGADPDDIALVFSGHESLSTDGAGNLVIGTSLEEIVLPRPEAFQVDGSGNESSVGWTPGYNIEGDTVRLTYGSFDGGKYLVFQVKETANTPTSDDDNLEWCTYFGGIAPDYVYGSAVDVENSFYITGETLSPNFPNEDGYQSSLSGDIDAFVSKFDNELNLSWSTFFGGSSTDISNDIALEGTNIYIIGYTIGFSNIPNANNFPLKDNGVAYHDDSNQCGLGNSGCRDAFIASFNSDGNLIFSTFFGNDGPAAFFSEWAKTIEIDKFGNIYIAGQGGSIPLVNTDNSPFFESDGRSFIASFTSGFENLTWSSHFKAGTIESIDSDSNGNIFLGGNVLSSDSLPVVQETSESYQSGFNGDNLDIDCFIAKISPSPHELLWSTHYGGTSAEFTSQVKTDRQDNVYIVGGTSSDDFFTLSPGAMDVYFDSIYGGVLDGFAWKFNNTGTPLFSTYIGGNRREEVLAIDVTDDNNVVLGMSSGSTGLDVISFGNFYVSDIASPNNPPYDDGYLIALDQNFIPIWATYFGDIGIETISTLSYSDDKLYFGGSVNITPYVPESDFPLRQYTANPDSYFLSMIGSVGNFNLPSLFLARMSFDLMTNVSSPGYNNLKTLRIFPNPANDFIHVFTDCSDQGIIFLLDFKGQVIQSFTKPRGQTEFEIPIENLPRGIYLLRVFDPDCELVGKFIRQ